MPSLTGSELLIKALEKEGADTIFSIPGGQLLGVYEAIRKSPVLDLIVPRHEGAGALMACGHALARGKPGVVMSTVGAGVIYELSGLSFAWLERVPLIFISPQVQSWRIKPIQENLQALDQDDMYSPMTKFHSIAYHVQRIPQLVGRAYKIAHAPEPGPVHLDLPLDVAFERRSFSRSRLESLMPGADKTRYAGRVGPDPSEQERACTLIDRSKRPLALVGRMASRMECVRGLEIFLARSRIPALTSRSAFSALPGTSDLRLSSFDLYTDEESLDLFAEADLVMYIEPDADSARMAQTIIGRSGPRPSVQVSSHPDLFNSFAPVSAALAGTPGLALERLSERIQQGGDTGRETWRDRLIRNRSRVCGLTRPAADEHRRQAPAHAFSMLNRVLGPEDVVVCEGDGGVLSAMLHLENYSAGRVFLLPDNVPSGTGFPLALGIKAGTEKGRVYLITDRSHFKYHCRELQTASRYQLGICSLIFSDPGPGSWSLPEAEPDFSLLAESLGVKGYSVTEPGEGLNETMLREISGAGSLIEFREKG